MARADQTPPAHGRLQAGGRAWSRPQRLDDDQFRAGIVHDLARPVPVYGGLVRRKNILSVIAQCFGIAGLVTILWVVFGYSMVFADGSGPFWGNMKFAMLKGVDSLPNTNYAYWVSHNVFSMYQLMFAIITPALILGAIAERMKFAAILVFVTLWMVVVYFPLAHMVWGIDGYMNGVWNAKAGIHAIDFAGAQWFT